MWEEEDNILLVIQLYFLYVLQVRNVPLAARIPNIVTTPWAACISFGSLPFPPMHEWLSHNVKKGGDALSVRCCRGKFVSGVWRRAVYSWLEYMWEQACGGQSKVTDRESVCLPCWNWHFLFHFISLMAEFNSQSKRLMRYMNIILRKLIILSQQH